MPPGILQESLDAYWSATLNAPGIHTMYVESCCGTYAGRPGGLGGIHVNFKFQVIGSSPGEVSLSLTFVPGKIGRDFF